MCNIKSFYFFIVYLDRNTLRNILNMNIKRVFSIFSMIVFTSILLLMVDCTQGKTKNSEPIAKARVPWTKRFLNVLYFHIYNYLTIKIRLVKCSVNDIQGFTFKCYLKVCQHQDIEGILRTSRMTLQAEVNLEKHAFQKML